MGKYVTGTIKCLKSPNDEDQGKEWSFIANFENNNLIGTYTINDDKKADPGCFYLNLKDKADTFRGYILLFQHQREAIEHHDYQWKRNA